jgi:hypothetical protein
MSGISKGLCLRICSTTLGPDSSRAREGHASMSAYSNSPECGKQDSILSETRRAAPSLCGGSVDSRAIIMKFKFFLEISPGHGSHILCKHLSPSDGPAWHPKPKSFRPVGRYPFMQGTAIWRTTTAEKTLHSSTAQSVSNLQPRRRENSKVAKH